MTLERISTKGSAPYLSAKTFLIGAAALVVVAGGVLLFGGASKGTEKTLVIQRQNFVQEVSLSGKVIAAQDVNLGFSQGGRISRVYVRVGDAVGAGRVLAETENGDLRAIILQKKAALEREKATLASLEAGTRGEEIAVAEAEVRSDETAYLQTKSAILDEIKDAYTTSDDVVHNKVDQFFSNPRSTSPQLVPFINDSGLKNSLENERVLIETVLSTWQGEIARLTEDSDLPLAVSRAGDNLAKVSSLLAKANAALNSAIPNQSMSQATINTHIAAIATARTAVNTSSSALTAATTAWKNAADALEVSKRNLELKRAPASASDINAQLADIKAAEADIARAEADLARTLIVSPFAGVITALDAEAGQIVSSNSAAVSMIGNGTFQIESFVPEVNVVLLEVRDSAAITLDAYGENETFAARIISIDPAETVRDGVSTYRVLLQFDAADERVRAGMTANVRIKTEEKSDVLAIPQGLIVERGGKKYVTVVSGKGTVEREVTTGSVSSLGDIEILSGLNEGDVVVFSE